MERLTFSAYGDRFSCNRQDLIRLGRKADPSISDDLAALRNGAIQFRVSFVELRQSYVDSTWAKDNILIAVAGASGDRTSGLNQAADVTVRREIEKFAHIIFSSNPSQREFWLGQKALSKDQIIATYDACKPCLHGSDAHALNTVGQPVGNRYSWIKGAASFDALRQACINPEGRAYVGETPPKSAMPSHVITHVSIHGAPGFQTPEVPLNPGLVAIIGSRGSGKTALADIIAAGCDSIPVQGWNANENASASFLVRARSLLGGASVNLTWGGGSNDQRPLAYRPDAVSFPKARYLSQQFVDELCSASGASDGLVEEIERVVFQSHDPSETNFASDFAELRDQKTQLFRQARDREELAISQISDAVALELEKEATVASLTAQVEQKKQVIAGYMADRSKLTLQDTQAQLQRHTELSGVAQALRTNIQNLSNQRRSFTSLQGEVASTRATGSPELLRQLRARHAANGMGDAQWDAFLLVHKGNVDQDLQGYIAWADTEIAKLTGVPPVPHDPKPLTSPTMPRSTASHWRCSSQKFPGLRPFTADQLTQKQYTALTDRISKEQTALNGIEQRLEDAKGAADRRKLLQTQRENAYERAIQAVINEQLALEQLYSPLLTRLAASSGTLAKLGLSVRRIADVDAWAAEAEEGLLDRRKTGSFQGIGAFTKTAKEVFLVAWETGSAADVRAAMTTFVTTHWKNLLAHAPSIPRHQRSSGRG